MGSLLNITGCPFSCGSNLVRVLSAGLEFSAVPTDHHYLPLDNIKAWTLAFDMDIIPWNRAWIANFSSDSTTPDSAGETSQGVGLPNSTYLTDSTLTYGNALFGFQRVQVLFSVPTNYLLLCVGWEVINGNPYYGFYDEGCAGVFGGACGVIEVPWSVIPMYPYVWMYLVGTGYNQYPNIETLATEIYGGSQVAGPDWNPNQTCGPWHCCDPFGEQFSAP
jgi:hypothetical protein